MNKCITMFLPRIAREDTHNKSHLRTHSHFSIFQNFGNGKFGGNPYKDNLKLQYKDIVWHFTYCVFFIFSTIDQCVDIILAVWMYTKESTLYFAIISRN